MYMTYLYTCVSRSMYCDIFSITVDAKKINTNTHYITVFIYLYSIIQYVSSQLGHVRKYLIIIKCKLIQKPPFPFVQNSFNMKSMFSSYQMCIWWASNILCKFSTNKGQIYIQCTRPGTSEGRILRDLSSVAKNEY